MGSQLSHKKSNLSERPGGRGKWCSRSGGRLGGRGKGQSKSRERPGGSGEGQSRSGGDLEAGEKGRVGLKGHQTAGAKSSSPWKVRQEAFSQVRRQGHCQGARGRNPGFGGVTANP